VFHWESVTTSTLYYVFFFDACIVFGTVAGKSDWRSHRKVCISDVDNRILLASHRFWTNLVPQDHFSKSQNKCSKWKLKCFLQQTFAQNGFCFAWSICSACRWHSLAAIIYRFAFEYVLQWTRSNSERRIRTEAQQIVIQYTLQASGWLWSTAMYNSGFEANSVLHSCTINICNTVLKY
jgi:hypothetical protein